MLNLQLPLKSGNIKIDRWEKDKIKQLYDIKIQSELNVLKVEELYDKINTDCCMHTKYDLMITYNDIVIGSIIIKLKFLDENIIEIGYMIDKKYQDRGFATNSVNILTEHINEYNRNIRILASVRNRNTSSFRVLNKCGFSEIGKTEILDDIYSVFEKMR